MRTETAAASIAPTTKLDALPISAMQEESSESLQSLLFWITAFSSSHIGMSAIRQTLITKVFGQFLANDVLGIVGTGKLRLPDFWPGDSSGTNELFPDIETTGRQFYRLFYTAVSFVTLGTSFSIYLSLTSDHSICTNTIGLGDIPSIDNRGETLAIVTGYAVATLSGAFSLASLVNASPLGLMPSFRAQTGEETSTGIAAVPAGNTLLGITRADELKFDPKGLTRITRHPLILPVVPWGFATTILAGGRLSDAILFGGLSLYAIVGCYCQDLRVLREEGSVGTTFFGSDKSRMKTTNEKLKYFYDQTSFLPFGAALDGRQSWGLVTKEFPILPFLLAIPLAFAIETALLRFLGVEYNLIL